MRITTKSSSRSGEALVTLLFFIIIAVTVTSAAVVVSVVNTRASFDANESLAALQTAESGAEEAILRLIRNPDYTGGTISVGNGSAQVQVVGDSTKLITSTGQQGNFEQTVEVETVYNNNVLSIISWNEVY